MMTDLIYTAAAASNPIGYVKRLPPPVSGFASFLFTQDTLADALKNVVAGGVDATPVGAPAVTAISATFTDANYIDTGVQETASMTLCAVVQRNTAQVMFMGAASSADSNGAKLYTNGASPRKPVFDARWSTSTGVAIDPSTTPDWPNSPSAYEVVFGVVDAAALKNRIYIPRLGLFVEATCTGARALSGRNVMLGCGPSPAAAYAGDTVLFKAAGVATRALSQAEMDTMYAWIKQRITGV